MTLERLDKLVETRLVNQEPPDQGEFDGLIERARRHLNDSQVAGVSEEGQFSLTYIASHSLALAIRGTVYLISPCELAIGCCSGSAFRAGQWSGS
jgi:hypothetical protein